MALWGGRFASGPDALFRVLNDSLPVDYRLAEADITGSIAWASALRRAGILTEYEHEQLVGALNGLLDEVRLDRAAPLKPLGDGVTAEDIHSWVEARLIATLGAPGKKLHTGRSRNDQVATDFRLWLRGAIDERRAEIRALRAELIGLAERELGDSVGRPGNGPTIMPGFTHMQRAQPILFAHWCLAYEQMLARDAARLGDARTRVNVCPLGSGALAGTTFAVDRAALAQDLGFGGPSANSLDATADRDFVLETLGAAGITAVHLSRLAEDLILFATQEFAFVETADEVSSGSSLMPQKKNPDALELMRGKAGRILGAQAALATTLKGLPLAYNKDLQEDKELCFDALEQLSLCLRMCARVIETLQVKRERCRDAALGGYTNATELADYLVAKGVPFREAHEMVGKIVREALEAGRRLEELPLEVLRRHCGQIERDVFAALTLEAGLARRNILGGTGPQAVAAALAKARQELATE